MHTGLVIVGSLLPIGAAAVYISEIVRGPVRPQRMTRLLLLIITILTFVSLLAGDDRSGIWLALASVIESVLVGALSLWRGIGGTDRLDIACLVLCGVGVGWWLLSGDSLAGLIASIVADLIACIPSLIKTIRLPHTESLRFYALGTLAGLCIVAAGPYDWRSLLFPLYIALINAAYVVPIAWPSAFRRKATPAAANGMSLDE